MHGWMELLPLLTFHPQMMIIMIIITIPILYAHNVKEKTRENMFSAVSNTNKGAPNT